MPGVRVSFGKRGTSLSIGGKGGRLTFGPSGTRASVGIPGTGISYSERIDGAYLRRKAERERNRLARAEAQHDRLMTRLEQEERRAEGLAKCLVKLKEDGRVEIENAFGEPLTGADLRIAWAQQGEAIEKWLMEQAEAINREAEQLVRVHEDTPVPADAPSYARAPFEEEAPGAPLLPPFSAVVPQPPRLYQPGWLDRLFPQWLGARLDRANDALTREYVTQMTAYDEERASHLAAEAAAEARWRDELRSWEERKSAHDAEQARLEDEWRQRVATDTGFMEEVLSDALNMLEWPLSTEVDFSIEDNGGTAWIDVDLPEIEDMPVRVASLAANGKRLTIKQKARAFSQ